GGLQQLELLGRQMTLDRFLHQLAQLVRLDGVKLDGDFAEVLRSRVASLGRAGRQIPVRDLLWSDGYTLEANLGIRRKFAQRLFDLLTGINAGGIEISEMVDVSRNVEIVDGLGRAVQERETCIAARYHQRHVVHAGNR